MVWEVVLHLREIYEGLGASCIVTNPSCAG